MILLDGLATAQKVKDQLKNKIANKEIEQPHLVVILVGEDAGSQVYVRNKEKACEYVGIKSTTFRLPASTSQNELMELIQKLNKDSSVDGILLQLPLPKGLDSQACLEIIHPMKDVDGLHPENQGRLSIGLSGLRPCTPSGVMNILKNYNIDPAGKQAVVIGRSNLVGKPVAVMLTAADATVTHCHSKTKNLKELCLQADILVAAIGKAKFVTKDMVKPGAVVIDVGMNRLDTGLCGDVDFENVKEVASAITPVPKGIGPMTIAQLLVNTVETKNLQKMRK